MDIEDKCQMSHLVPINDIIYAFCTTLENAGYFAGVYSYRSFLNTYVSETTRKRFSTWIAEVDVSKPSYASPYHMWQYSWKGKVPGICREVDMDYCYVDFPKIITEKKCNGYGPSNPATTVEEKPVVKEEKKYEAPAEVKTEPVVESKPKVEREIITPSNLDEVISKTEVYLADIFKAMKVDTKIEITFNKEYNDLDIDLSGEEMGLLIGKRGATLDSIQYLTSLYTNKISDQYVRVKIDTEGYRARRKKTLEHLARNVARKVAKTRRPVYLEPMNPYERRIIHSALQNDRYVVTRSEGEEPYRKVVIVLKDRRR
jgi:spoIIIJ-associated protein